MSILTLILREEWLYWKRSRLSASAFAIAFLILTGAAVNTWFQGQAEKETREQFQDAAEAAFLAQPARHPHRMVHFGHYAFRNPVPLASLDSGISAYTGSVIFLEGHRQNSAMFAPATELSSLTGFGDLTPAFALQILGPLIIIVLGFSGLTREKENQTLVQLQASGLSTPILLAGKALALMSAAILLLIPLVMLGLALVAFNGASIGALLLLVLFYAVYLLVWCLLVTSISALTSRSATALATLIMAWIFLVVALPRLSATSVAALAPMPGKIETDLTMQTAEQTPDAHNSSDPGYSALIASLLEQYGVDDVSQLPMNIRGVTAMEGESQLTDQLNHFAEQQYAGETAQVSWLDRLAVLSPTSALRQVSMALSATDLNHQHKFMREAEKLRFTFVQSLNQVHAEQLNYEDDRQKSNNYESEQRTRVDAANWRILPEFTFRPASVSIRLSDIHGALASLILWLAISLGLFAIAGRRLQP